MLKILAIGNSFSEDSTTYLYDLAKSDGVELKVVNLYIGGCCLERHWNNVLENKADYEYQLNGQRSGKLVSIKEVLEEDAWDIITMQQCSGYSGLLETYYPYITLLSNYVRQFVPEAMQLIHQTWAYEIDSDHPQFHYYDNSQNKMYENLVVCYEKVADELSLKIIPFGSIVQTLRTIPEFDYGNGGISLCRDGFHMSMVYGRYALAATWYEYVVKGNILNNPYIPPVIEEVVADEQVLQIIKTSIHNMVNS
jgi:hypothetical protein